MPPGHLTLHVDTHAKHQQDLSLQGERWFSVEGENGQVKDTSTQGIEEAERRRVRGIAASTLLVAFGIAARNLAKIDAFYRASDDQPEGGMAVTRGIKKRRRRHGILSEHRPARPDYGSTAHPADRPAAQALGTRQAGSGQRHRPAVPRPLPARPEVIAARPAPSPRAPQAPRPATRRPNHRPTAPRDPQTTGRRSGHRPDPHQELCRPGRAS